MHLLSAAWLWLLLGLLVLGAVYAWAQIRRSRYVVRFTNLDLLASVAPARPGWRRHVVAGVFAVAAVLLVIALARPARTVEVPREEATVILAIDTSLSMEADDVEPNRIEAAQAAAVDFARELPPTLRLGLVSFSGISTVEVAPTTDRELVVDAIQDLDLDEGTAIGDGILASLDAIEDVPSASEDGTPPPGAIVLLSDGETTLGTENDIAADEAAEQGVPVTTIAFGTPEGTVEIEGEIVSVAVDEDDLQEISVTTGGTAFDAESEAELASVYTDIGSQIGYEEEDREISRWFLGAGLIALMACAAFSLAWSSRVL
jgi:Ca-activated chloride channel homolog